MSNCHIPLITLLKCNRFRGILYQSIPFNGLLSPWSQNIPCGEISLLAQLDMPQIGFFKDSKRVAVQLQNIFKYTRGRQYPVIRFLIVFQCKDEQHFMVLLLGDRLFLKNFCKLRSDRFQRQSPHYCCPDFQMLLLFPVVW